MNKRLFYALISATLSATIVFANTNADEVITERQAAMKAVGQSAKAGDFAALSDATARAIEAFAIDTRGLETSVASEAKDEIWDEEENVKFNALLQELKDGADASDKAAVFSTCKACHKAYRL